MGNNTRSGELLADFARQLSAAKTAQEKEAIQRQIDSVKFTRDMVVKSVDIHASRPVRNEHDRRLPPPPISPHR